MMTDKQTDAARRERIHKQIDQWFDDVRYDDTGTRTHNAVFVSPHHGVGLHVYDADYQAVDYQIKGNILTVVKTYVPVPAVSTVCRYIFPDFVHEGK
jgi:hypothetical protein